MTKLLFIVLGACFLLLGGAGMVDAALRLARFPSENSGYQFVPVGAWIPRETKRIGFGGGRMETAQIGRLGERDAVVLGQADMPFFVRRVETDDPVVSREWGMSIETWKAVKNPRWDLSGDLLLSLIVTALGGGVMYAGIQLWRGNPHWKSSQMR